MREKEGLVECIKTSRCLDGCSFDRKQSAGYLVPSIQHKIPSLYTDIEMSELTCLLIFFFLFIFLILIFYSLLL